MPGGEIANANVALVLVLAVLVGALIGGRLGGATTALVAAASFDFFHTRPYNSLKIISAADVEATVLLLLVALAVAEVAVRLERVRVRLRDDGRQLRRLHRVAEMAAGGEHLDDLLLAITAELIETFRLRDCWFERPPYVATFPRMERNGTVIATEHWYARGELELPRDGVELCVIGGGVTLGRFVLVPTRGVGVSAERRIIGIALADQLGVAMAQRAA